jgi:predicted permease
MERQFTPGSRGGALDSRNISGTLVFGRLKPGVSLARADADLDVVNARMKREHPETAEGSGIGVEQATGIPARSRGEAIVAVSIFLGVAALVLMIACLNVASMLLARSIARRREIAIRLAVGATRVRIVRQLLVESLMLFLVGASAGLIVALWSIDAATAFLPTMDGEISLDLGLDPTVLVFTLVVALVTGIAFGLAPALRASRPDLVPALKDAAPAARGGRSLMRSAFVTVQVCFSLVLLICSGLFLRSLQHAASLDPGFDATNVHVVPLNAGLHGYDDTTASLFFDDLLGRLRASDGIESASLARMLPLGGSAMIVSTFIEGGTTPPDEAHHLDVTMVAPGYFSTLRIPILRGRDFTASDRIGSTPVVIINEEMAKRFWPGQDPIGKRVSNEGPGGPWMEVIGVARSGRYESIAEDPRPFLYQPLGQMPSTEAFLVVRSTTGGASSMATVRRHIKQIDPDMPVTGGAPLEHYTGLSLSMQRFAAGIAGTFGLLGLVLAAIGIYGLVAYAVAQRTHELGIRAALGATRRDLLAMVLRRGMRPVFVGIGLGLIGLLVIGALMLGLRSSGHEIAEQATDLMSTLLLGFSPVDPVTYVLVTLTLIAVALLATLIPARRATKVDPMTALRYE